MARTSAGEPGVWVTVAMIPSMETSVLKVTPTIGPASPSLGASGWAIHQVAGAQIDAAKQVTMTGIGSLGAVYLLDAVTAEGDVIIDGLTANNSSNWSVRLGAPTKTIWSKRGNIGITGQSGGYGLYVNSNLLAGNAATPTSGGSISLSGKSETAAADRAGLAGDRIAHLVRAEFALIEPRNL